jgi:hypothetical protein
MLQGRVLWVLFNRCALYSADDLGLMRSLLKYDYTYDQ